MWGHKSTASRGWDVRGQRCCHQGWVKETGVLSEEYGFRGHLSFFPVRFGNGKGGVQQDLDARKEWCKPMDKNAM
jgi:hypothetical protein